MSKVYDWFEERLEIQAIADDITSKYDTAQFTTDSGYGHPSITIFTSPTPFISSSSSSLPSYIGSRQELAVRSWLALSPNITVVLFSNHPSIKAFARSLGSRVSVESNIDFT